MDLPELDLGCIKPFYGDEAAIAKVKVELPDDPTHHKRTSGKRHFLEQLDEKNAYANLKFLPGPGESIHCVMRGNCNGWDLIPAVLRLARPERIRHLWIATGGYSARNVAELLELIDDKTVEQVSLICSAHFKALDSECWQRVHDAMVSRGHRSVTIRCHCKIRLLEMTDGRKFVVESSANLRSCRTIEQFALFNDQDLFDFHASWMDYLIRQCMKG